MTNSKPDTLTSNEYDEVHVCTTAIDFRDGKGMRCTTCRKSFAPSSETRALATYRELNYAQLCELCARLEAENAALKGATLNGEAPHG